MACISGTVVLRLLLGDAAEFGDTRLTVLPSDVLPSYLILGILAGLLGVAFNISLVAGLRLSDRAALATGREGRALAPPPGCLPGFFPIWWVAGKVWPRMQSTVHFPGRF